MKGWTWATPSKKLLKSLSEIEWSSRLLLVIQASIQEVPRAQTLGLSLTTMSIILDQNFITSNSFWESGKTFVSKTFQNPQKCPTITLFFLAFLSFPKTSLCSNTKHSYHQNRSYFIMKLRLDGDFQIMSSLRILRETEDQSGTDFIDTDLTICNQEEVVIYLLLNF